MDFQYRGLSRLHDTYWPPGQSRKLSLSQTNLSYNVEVAAARFPDKPFIVFYDATLTFGVFKDETERVAGYLQQDCGVQAGDRVLLYMQNSPQWIIAYYGILRANAVVVPVNPDEPDRRAAALRRRQRGEGGDRAAGPLRADRAARRRWRWQWQWQWQWQWRGTRHPACAGRCLQRLSRHGPAHGAAALRIGTARGDRGGRRHALVRHARDAPRAGTLGRPGQTICA